MKVFVSHRTAPNTLRIPWFGHESGKTDGLDFGLAGFPAAARSPSEERACRRPREMRADARRRAVLESCRSDHWFGSESGKTDGLDFGLAGFPAAARSPSDERACCRPREMRAGARRRAVLESCQSDRWFGNASLFIFGQPGLRLQLDSLDFGYFQRKIVKKCGFEFGRAIRIL